MAGHLVMVVVPIEIVPLPGVTISCHRLSVPAFVSGLIAATVAPVQG